MWVQPKWGMAHEKELFWALLPSDNHKFCVWQWGHHLLLGSNEILTGVCGIIRASAGVAPLYVSEGVCIPQGLRDWTLAGVSITSFVACDSCCHYLYWSSRWHRNSQQFSLVADALLFSLHQVALGLLQVTFGTLRMAKKGYSATGIGENKLEAAEKTPKSLVVSGRGYREPSHLRWGLNIVEMAAACFLLDQTLLRSISVNI